jgi:hypothetical protein
VNAAAVPHTSLPLTRKDPVHHNFVISAQPQLNSSLNLHKSPRVHFTDLDDEVDAQGEDLRDSWVMSRFQWISYAQILFNQLDQNSQSQVKLPNYLLALEKILPVLPLHQQS